MPRPTINADEVDCFLARHRYARFGRSGVARKIKRGANRRYRQQAKTAIHQGAY